MAKLEDNLLFHGASGKIGDFVIRKSKSGKQIIARAPRSKNNWKATSRQAVCRKKIKSANDYADTVMADPKLTAYYQPHLKDDLNIHNLAVRDYMKLPKVLDYKLEWKADSNELVLVIVFPEKKQLYTVVVTLYDQHNQEIYSAAAKPGVMKEYWEFSATYPAMNQLHHLEILARDKVGQTDQVMLMPGE